MARINIEECWWSDPRRDYLRRLLKVEVQDQVAIQAWRLSQEHWEKGRLIPGYVFITLFGYYELLTANLAQLHENEHPNSSKCPTPIQHISSTSQHDPTRIQDHSTIIQQGYIYVRGSCEYLSWGKEIRQKRILAGQKSAERPRDSKGRLLAQSTNIQQTSNTHPANTNTVQLSGSGSGSGSGSRSSSGSKKKSIVGIRLDYPREFEEFWKQYGLKGDKKASYQEFQKLNLTEDLLETLPVAISNYQIRNPDPQFRKDFERFLQMDWRELKALPLNNGVHPKTQERVSTLDRFKAKAEASENGGSDEL